MRHYTPSVHLASFATPRLTGLVARVRSPLRPPPRQGRGGLVLGLLTDPGLPPLSHRRH